MKSLYPKSICVYIAPLKALARERLKEWRNRLGVSPLNWSVLELSGDTHHEKGALEKADILVCTPEKWDLISRGWKGMAGTSTREFVKRVRLLVLDEVHLLGEERGAVLEAIVSRTRFISRQLQSEEKSSNEPTRIVGLSTMLANPVDLADWIGIDTTGHGPSTRRGLYNFRPSVRPVPTRVHLQGYTGKHYCPRYVLLERFWCLWAYSVLQLMLSDFAFAKDGHDEPSMFCGDKGAFTNQADTDFCSIKTTDKADCVCRSLVYCDKYSHRLAASILLPTQLGTRRRKCFSVVTRVM